MGVGHRSPQPPSVVHCELADGAIADHTDALAVAWSRPCSAQEVI
jgi:hypothetical protein